MKVLSIVALIAVASASGIIEALGIGQACNSNGGFTITSFTVNPYPPVKCAVQSVSLTGTSTSSYCLNQIHIHEVYNQRQGYDQQINNNTCLTSGQSATFNFNINTFQCNAGNYQIQVTLQTQNPQQSDVACWEYSYTLGN